MPFKDKRVDETHQQLVKASGYNRFVTDLIHENARLKDLLQPFLDMYDRSIAAGHSDDWYVNGVHASHFRAIAYELRDKDSGDKS